MASFSNGSPEVLVVGAGPVGLTMACELARHGVPCRIVDASPGPTEQSRALAIHARTLEVFEDLGIVDEVLAKARKAHGVAAFSSDGSRIMHITFDLEGLETPYPYTLILPQGETERLLVERLKKHGIEVERQVSLTGLAQDGSGVTASLLDAEGNSSESRTPWLIGCDGARSAVRKGLGLPFEGADYPESFLLADVRLSWDRPDDEVTIITSPEGQLAGFPLPEPGRWRLMHISTGTIDESEAVPSHAVSRFQTMLHENGRPEAVVSDPGWISVFKIHRRVVGRFREGRCFVAGDAAHIHSPAGGQGMNTGIQDAYNLAWKLGLVVQGVSPDSLLDSYSAERRPVVAGVVHSTHFMTRLITLRSDVAKTVRNHLIGLLSEFEFVARKISKSFSELGIEYHASPIVREDRGEFLLTSLGDRLGFRSGPHPGDRVPDLHLEPPPDNNGPHRLFDVLRGTKHVLLMFEGAHGLEDAGPLQAVARVASEHAEQMTTILVARGDVAPPSFAWVGRTLLDHMGELHRRFGARGPCLYLVRPDGYLGYRAIPPDAAKLADYLQGIFGR
jgi:2-polyprenyl-6-methoxyphenol hydroxylase-like FAD-dependent oxidoreductase